MASDNNGVKQTPATVLAGKWGARVAARRRILALSQAEVAEKVGVAQRTISRIERGQQMPSTIVKYKVARALRTTVDDLFWQPRQMPRVPDSESAA